MRILVLRGGALGDFILTLPALCALRQRWPEARIELAGNSRAGELGLISGTLDCVHSQNEARWSALYAAAPLPVPFREWLEGFDLVVSFWSDLDGTLRAHFAHRGPQFIAASPRVTARPASRHFCDALGALGAACADHQARLQLPASLIAEADRLLGGFREFVAIHPGSGSGSKNWPVERWAELAARLGQPLLAITGEAEPKTVFWPEDLFVQRAHEWPLPLLAAALSRCTRYFGHDTGISHLAAAVGAPCVLLFGPTDPEMWAPVGRHVRVVKRGARLDDIRVADVLGAVQPVAGVRA